MSALVLCLCSPVYGSSNMIPSPKLVNETRLSSSEISLSGIRPQARNVPGAELIASSTTCGGILATFVLESMTAPLPANSSIASLSSTKTPVFVRTSSVAK